MNINEDPNIFPKLELAPLTQEEVGSNLTEEELTMHNQLVEELEKGVQDFDPKWEHYHFLHNKALGIESDQDQQMAA